MTMQKNVDGPNTSIIKKDQMLCATGEKTDHLYMIHSGELMVFANNGTLVTPLAIIKEGEYFGEMSFFDHHPRSANVIALKDTTLIRLSIDNLEEQFPDWLLKIASSMVKKLRKSSDLIRQKGIRRQNVESIKPLSIDEQRHYYKVLQDYLAK
jgi:CRP-like cAMP-binding protein